MKPDASLVGWYFRRGNERVGPLPIQEIARLLRAGQLRPGDMLIEIGEAEAGARYSYVTAAAAVEKGRFAQGQAR